MTWSAIAGACSNGMFSFIKELAKLFARIAVAFYIPASNVREIGHLSILNSIWYWHFFVVFFGFFLVFSQFWLFGYKDISLWPQISLPASNIVHLFMHSSVICVSSWIKISLLSFVHFLIGLFVILLLSLRGVFFFNVF